VSTGFRLEFTLSEANVPEWFLFEMFFLTKHFAWLHGLLKNFHLQIHP